MFAAARAADEAGSTQAAIEMYQAALRRYPLASEAATAQYRLAELLESKDDLFPRLQRLPDASHALSRYAEFLSAPWPRRFHREQIPSGTPRRSFSACRLATPPSARRRCMRTSSPTRLSANTRPWRSSISVSPTRSRTSPSRPSRTTRRFSTTTRTAMSCDDALYQIGYVNMRIGLAQTSQDLSALIAARHTFEDFLSSSRTARKLRRPARISPDSAARRRPTSIASRVLRILPQSQGLGHLLQRGDPPPARHEAGRTREGAHRGQRSQYGGRTPCARVPKKPRPARKPRCAAASRPRSRPPRSPITTARRNATSCPTNSPPRRSRSCARMWMTCSPLPAVEPSLPNQ